MIGHVYLHAGRNSEPSLYGKCNIPLKGNEINQALYKLLRCEQIITTSTNHYGANNISLRANY